MQYKIGEKFRTQHNNWYLVWQNYKTNSADVSVRKLISDCLSLIKMSLSSFPLWTLKKFTATKLLHKKN